MTTLHADECPQNVHKPIDEMLTCHLGILYDECGNQNGRCPYCHKVSLRRAQPPQE